MRQDHERGFRPARLTRQDHEPGFRPARLTRLDPSLDPDRPG
ncbi:hypothetical protein [Streptomyces chartreusis]